MKRPSHRMAPLVLAAAAMMFVAACGAGGGQAQQPSPSSSLSLSPSPSGFSFDPVVEPTVVETPLPPGLTIEDSCVRANIPARQGVGQIRGGGLDLQVEASSPQAFSRAVADTATIICAPGVTQAEVDGLIARLTGIEGVVVRGHSWTPG